MDDLKSEKEKLVQIGSDHHDPLLVFGIKKEVQ